MTAARGDVAKAARPLRADAQRNRAAILRAARETYETDGVLAPIDGIALRAGVGNATLYRNFPTREDLLAAVVQDSIEEARVEAEALSAARDPRTALAEWLVTLAWRLRIWHDLPYCVAAAHSDGDSSMSTAVNPLLTETGRLLHAAQSSGDALDGVSPDEVFELVTTLSWGIDRFGDDEAAARRRVQVATAGIFTQTSRAGAG